MAPLDSSQPIPDIADGQPAGDNLEFDPDFAELERLAQGKPEQQYGATVVPAEEPDWKEVVTAAWALTERTYDLRVLAQLAVARLHREGATGYADTLGLIRHLLQDRWTEIHPQLDPDDDNDPTLRANALLTVAEPVRVLRTLRLIPLARSARAGAVSWRDIAIATGQIDAPEDTPKVSEGVVAAAFRETDPAGLATLRESLAAAASASAAIQTAFEDNAGYGTNPDLAELIKLLRDMLRMIDAHPQDAAASPEPEDDVAQPGDDHPATPGAAPTRSAPILSIASMGPPTNRGDALRLLDLSMEYFKQAEPSSPLPLLIARALRLADKTFIEILRDMAPDGVEQAQRVAGVTDYD